MMAPRTFSNNTLVVSHDQTLAAQLQGILEEDHRCQVEFAFSYQEAEALLEVTQPQAVFLDLRKAATREDPSCLLRDLSQRGKHRAAVIAVSEAGYVCDWAGVADLIISGHLQLPLDRRQLARLLETELDTSPGRVSCRPPSPRVVRSESVTYRTSTPEMSAMLDDVGRMAAHDVTVLLVGETGTGKTRMARMIHELSPRSKSKFLTVACGALPPELIESELFGHVQGAFTSADRSKSGKFEAAENGSLLLDEIDILKPNQQAKLLRVIETGEYERVGCNETRTSRATLIAASNVNLKELMESGQFRPDLYYRLNMLEFQIPPLRRRQRDIVPLALEFVDEFCVTHGVEIRQVHPEFLACLKGYGWPGNVRELKNHVRRAVLFCRSSELTPSDLAPHLVRSMQEAPPADSPSTETTLLEMVASTEREMLDVALRENNHNRTQTANALGLSRVGLYKKMKRYGMITPRKIPARSASE